jgi:5-oxoprolinase (ATP-hydrolysing) subunit B
MNASTVRISRLGQSTLVLDVQGELSLETQRRIWSLASDAQTWRHVREVVPGMNNLSLIFEWKEQDPDVLASRLQSAWSATMSGLTAPNAPIEIPVRYGGDDGPDLAHVAERAGIGQEDAIALHSAAKYAVYFLGFRPGFAYLGGLDARLASPRLARPRRRIAAGSVGIGGEQTGIYAIESPGGWNIIGRTSSVLFDPQRTPPSLLAPGDVVRFVRVE